MNHFKFKHTVDVDSSPVTTTKTFATDQLDDVFFQLTDFLRGIGYVFDGEVGTIKEESIFGEFCNGQFANNYSDNRQTEFDFSDQKNRD